MSNPNKDKVPSAAEFGQWRAQLAQAGIKQADINTIWGDNVNGRTWGHINNDAKGNMRLLPKA